MRRHALATGGYQYDPYARRLGPGVPVNDEDEAPMTVRHPSPYASEALSGAMCSMPYAAYASDDAPTLKRETSSNTPIILAALGAVGIGIGFWLYSKPAAAAAQAPTPQPQPAPQPSPSPRPAPAPSAAMPAPPPRPYTPPAPPVPSTPMTSTPQGPSGMAVGTPYASAGRSHGGPATAAVPAGPLDPGQITSTQPEPMVAVQTAPAETSLVDQATAAAAAAFDAVNPFS